MQMQNLLEHVVFCVLNSSAKDEMITKILQLSQNSQVSLMHFIKQATREDDSLDFMMTPTRELKQLRLSQAKLSSQLAHVQNDFEAVYREKERIEQEFSELKLANTDLENKLGHRLQRRNFTPDSIILDLEVRLSDKNQRIQHLTEELCELQKSSENALSQYRDELDTANSKIESLSKLEQSALQLKLTVEELKPLKEQLKLAQDESEALQRRLKSQEESDLAQQSMSKQLAQTKEALASEKARSMKLEDELTAKELQTKSLLRDNAELIERIQNLESKNRELMLRLDQLMTESMAEDSFAIGTPLREIGEASLYRSDNASLRLEDESRSQRIGDFWASDRSQRAMKEVVLLANEIRDLKMERDALTSELASMKQTAEMDKIAKAVEVASVKEAFEREIQSLKATLCESEATIRGSNRDFTDQITALTASVKAAEMINQSLLEEISSVRSDRDALSEELARSYKEKDELCSRFVASRDETIRLNSELADKMLKICALESEVSSLSEFRPEVRLRTAAEESTRDLEMVESGREISSLKLRVSELESEVKTKEILCDQFDSQLKSQQELLVKSREKRQSQRSKISRLSRTKEELTAVMSNERSFFLSITSEMVKTMGDLQGLVDAKSNFGS